MLILVPNSKRVTRGERSLDGDHASSFIPGMPRPPPFSYLGLATPPHPVWLHLPKAQGLLIFSRAFTHPHPIHAIVRLLENGLDWKKTKSLSLAECVFNRKSGQMAHQREGWGRENGGCLGAVRVIETQTDTRTDRPWDHSNRNEKPPNQMSQGKQKRGRVSAGAP